MPKLKLTYFDFHGGRGEVARMALHMANVPFEDERFHPKDGPARKPSTPFGGFPVLEVDGQKLAQSNTINRYVGKLTKLYPDDPLQAAFCDEAMDAIEDISVKVSASLFIKDEAEKKRAREALAEGPITNYLRALDARLGERGGEWFADGRLTVADLKVYIWIRHLKSGNLEHVPTDLPDRVGPRLVDHFRRVKADPRVRTYCDARGIT
jgi:prostaglandin-H2 D-isomerase / glutathione transferase